MVVFVVILSSISIVGCTKKDDKSTKNSSNVSAIEKIPDTDGLPQKDLGGYEFIVAEGWYYGEETKPSLELGVSDLNDQIIARNSEIQKRFNCKITYQYFNPVTFFDEVSVAILAGDKIADVVTPTMFNYGKFVNGALLTDLKTIPYIKLDKPWWNKNIENATRVGDKSFGSSNQMARTEGNAFVVFFNKNLVQKLQLENPYELVTQDKWNWDKFSELANAAIKDLNGDGTFNENDQWGVTGPTSESMEALFVSSGLNLISQVNGNKIPQYNLSEPNSIDALIKMKDMFKSNGSFYNPNMDYNMQLGQFMNGKSLFFINPLYQYDYLREMSDDFGVVPMPKGMGTKDYHTLVTHNAPVVSVPITIDNKENTGLILEAMAFASYKEKKIWLDQLSTKLLRDEESAKNINDHVFTSITTDVSYLWHNISPEISQGTSGAVTFPILTDRTLEPKSYTEQYKTLIQTFLNEAYSK